MKWCSVITHRDKENELSGLLKDTRESEEQLRKVADERAMKIQDLENKVVELERERNEARAEAMRIESEKNLQLHELKRERDEARAKAASMEYDLDSARQLVKRVMKLKE
jgi:TolA-binding protein